MNWPWTKKQAVTTPKVREQFIPLPSAVLWDSDDVQVWRQFLKTPTGAKLVEVCRAKVLTDAINGCHGTEKEASKAAGGDELLRWQFNLASEDTLKRISEATPVEVAKQNTDNQEQDALSLSDRRCS